LTVVGSEQAEIGARTLINARVTWESANRNWSAALSGTNLRNKQYFINKRDLYEVYGMTVGQPGRPREWAITLRRVFRSGSRITLDRQRKRFCLADY
jgi:iron complex outermembrane recepter protein